MARVHADFNGLFGDILCLSHGETSIDESGGLVRLQSGMVLTAFEEDIDEKGGRDDLIATGVVETAPDWLQKHGSQWVLRIDQNGVRHESDIPNKT